MDAPVREGEVLAGKYRVEHVLGAGGMGVVVSAQHVQLGQRVALKFLRPEACRDAAAVERFLREARAAVRIHSEHVARVSDVGTLETGSPYMVMEYLDGRDLSDVVQAQGPLPIATAVDYLLQACEAVAEAHSLAIVHRDLKPANLFLTRRPDGSSLIKVLDFGISKARPLDQSDLSKGTMTATTMVMGSPMYMSPEQVRSAKSVDARSDIWALGVVLHELISGRTVYEADTMPGLLAMIVADPPAPLRMHRPDAPPGLELLILRCLEKDPKRRPQNVGELAKELLPFALPRARLSVERILGVLQLHPSSGPWHASQPAGARNPASSAPEPAASGQTSKAWGHTRSGQAGKSSAWMVVLAAALVAVVGAGAWVLLASSRRPAASLQRHDASGSGNSAAPSALPAVEAPPQNTALAPSVMPSPAPSTVATASTTLVMPAADPAPSSAAPHALPTAPPLSRRAAAPAIPRAVPRSPLGSVGANPSTAAREVPPAAAASPKPATTSSKKSNYEDM